MYMIFLEILATKEVKDIVGGRRDLIIRVYGLFLAGVAIAIEIDVAWVVKVCIYSFFDWFNYGFIFFHAFEIFLTVIGCMYVSTRTQIIFFQSVYGFKGFLARSFLIFFISSITAPNPLYFDEGYLDQNSVQYYYDDKADQGDDASSYTYNSSNTSVVPEVPMSVVIFQRVTSFIL